MTDPYRAGYLRAVERLREMAATALVDEPTNLTRHLCLTSAAADLERRAGQLLRRTATPDLFTLQPAAPAQAAE